MNILYTGPKVEPENIKGIDWTMLSMERWKPEEIVDKRRQLIAAVDECLLEVRSEDLELMNNGRKSLIKLTLKVGSVFCGYLNAARREAIRLVGEHPDNG